MKHGVLERSILATLAYYDALVWPLTALELWTRLIVSPSQRREDKARENAVSLYEVISRCEDSPYLQELINKKNGFYFLRGRDTLVQDRIRAMKISEEKTKKLWRYRWLFLGVPFVKGAFLGGSVAGGWAKPQSDIDLLVIASSGRVWSARFFLTIWTSFLGVRRKGKRIANRMCINHYISDDALLVPFESLYNAQSYLYLVPFVNRNQAFERFFDTNAWIKSYVSGAPSFTSAPLFVYSCPSFSLSLLEKIMQCERRLEEWIFSGWIGDILEVTVKRLQLFFIRRNPLTGKPGGRITAEDWQLEFHPESKEAQVLSSYDGTLRKFGLDEFYDEPDSGLK